jgi:hypothetical protein
LIDVVRDRAHVFPGLRWPAHACHACPLCLWWEGCSIRSALHDASLRTPMTSTPARSPATLATPHTTPPLSLVPSSKLVMSADWARVQWSSLSESNVSLTDTPRTHKEEMQMHKHIIEALASSTAAVSSQRRRMGFTKGDRCGGGGGCGCERQRQAHAQLRVPHACRRHPRADGWVCARERHIAHTVAAPCAPCMSGACPFGRQPVGLSRSPHTPCSTVSSACPRCLRRPPSPTLLQGVMGPAAAGRGPRPRAHRRGDGNPVRRHPHRGGPGVSHHRAPCSPQLPTAPGSAQRRLGALRHRTHAVLAPCHGRYTGRGSHNRHGVSGAVPGGLGRRGRAGPGGGCGGPGPGDWPTPCGSRGPEYAVRSCTLMVVRDGPAWLWCTLALVAYCVSLD